MFSYGLKILPFERQIINIKSSSALRKMFLNILTAMYLQAHVRTFILHGENITILNCAKLFTFNKFTSNIDG